MVALTVFPVLVKLRKNTLLLFNRSIGSATNVVKACFSERKTAKITAL